MDGVAASGSRAVVAAGADAGAAAAPAAQGAQAPRPPVAAAPQQALHCQEAAPPLFSLAQLLKEALPQDTLPRVRVVDVGAMLLSEAEDVWRPLLRRGLCASVVGFEPNADECERLNASVASVEPLGATAASGSGAPPPPFRFLPWALGDGSRGQFRLCSAPMTSSMLEPNIPLLRRFVQLEEVTTVVSRTEMQTRRLDDLREELPGGVVDYLKLDVQGYELAVLKGAERTLEKVLVLHTEVEFVHMYEHQPLFADVDQFLRGRGFTFHRFASVHGRPMKPIHLNQNPLQPISQQLWADAVYVRDMWELKDHSRDELLRTAIILHEVYHSYDVVHHVLQRCDEALAKRYLDRVLAAG